MHSITNQNDLRSGNVVSYFDVESIKFELTKLTPQNLHEINLENDPNVQRVPLSVPVLRKLGFVPIKGARKISLHGKSFAYVLENVHLRGEKFEFELQLPIVKRLKYLDQLQNLFQVLEGYELNAENLLTEQL